MTPERLGDIQDVVRHMRKRLWSSTNGYPTPASPVCRLPLEMAEDLLSEINRLRRVVEAADDWHRDTHPDELHHARFDRLREAVDEYRNEKTVIVIEEEQK